LHILALCIDICVSSIHRIVVSLTYRSYFYLNCFRFESSEFISIVWNSYARAKVVVVVELHLHLNEVDVVEANANAGGYDACSDADVLA
jgi:hypothetical protein